METDRPIRIVPNRGVIDKPARRPLRRSAMLSRRQRMLQRMTLPKHARSYLANVSEQLNRVRKAAKPKIASKPAISQDLLTDPFEDPEYRVQTSETMIDLASIRLMLNRIAHV
jgi:hypothetical protein